jgi:hypothetical protein
LGKAVGVGQPNLGFSGHDSLSLSEIALPLQAVSFHVLVLLWGKF